MEEFLVDPKARVALAASERLLKPRLNLRFREATG
jgi:hypothetical protein